MKTTINGKRYNTEKCVILATHDHHSYSNNYAGTTSLLRASDGAFLTHTSANGQDCHVQNSFGACDDATGFLDNAEMDNEQEERCVELGLIVIV